MNIYTHCQLCCVIYQDLASDLNTDHHLYLFKFIQAQSQPENFCIFVVNNNISFPKIVGPWEESSTFSVSRDLKFKAILITNENLKNQAPLCQSFQTLSE